MEPDQEYSYFFVSYKILPIELNDRLQMRVNGQIVSSDDNSCDVNSNSNINSSSNSNSNSNSNSTSNSSDGGKNKNSAKYNLKMIRLYYVLIISLLLF